MKRSFRALVLVSGGLAMAAATDEQIAFIKSDHVFIADSDRRIVRQLDSDPRPKGMLRWDGPRKRLSYFVDKQNGEIARLVVTDLTGKLISEIAIRPVTDPPTGGLHDLMDVAWTPDGKIRVIGGINPSKCEMFDLDVETGKESNWQMGVCGTFTPSPDGKHIAEIGLMNHFVPEGQEVNSVQLDNKEEFYMGIDDQEVAILAGPAWSPDSQNIAAIERRRVTGEAAVVILTLSGVPTRIPISATILEHPAITWVGDKVVAGEGSDAVLIYSDTKRAGPVTSDVADELARRAEIRERAALRKKQVESVVKQAGGRDGTSVQ